MNLRSLASGLLYRGEAEGVRQTYYIFEGRKYYFVMSFSKAKKNAGNFNIVDTEALNYVLKKMASNTNITSKKLFKQSKKPNFIGTPLEALNILYVLVALRKAKIDNRFKDNELHFNIK